MLEVIQPFRLSLVLVHVWKERMWHCGLHSDSFYHTGILSLWQHLKMDFYHSLIAFDLKQSEKYRISITRFTEKFVPPSWMLVAPPGHEGASLKCWMFVQVWLLLGQRLISFRRRLDGVRELLCLCTQPHSAVMSKRLEERGWFILCYPHSEAAVTHMH